MSDESKDVPTGQDSQGAIPGSPPDDFQPEELHPLMPEELAEEGQPTQTPSTETTMTRRSLFWFLAILAVFCLVIGLILGSAIKDCPTCEKAQTRENCSESDNPVVCNGRQEGKKVAILNEEEIDVPTIIRSIPVKTVARSDSIKKQDNDDTQVQVPLPLEIATTVLECRPFFDEIVASDGVDCANKGFDSTKVKGGDMEACQSHIQTMINSYCQTLSDIGGGE